MSFALGARASFLFVLVVASASVRCTSSSVGDPCVPVGESDPTSLGADPGAFTVDVKSYDCDTRICMSQYFRGRVSCPYGNSMNGAVDGVLTPGPCLEVPGYRGYFTDTGTTTGNLCCPILGVDPTFVGDQSEQPIQPPGNKILRNVPAQCAARTAAEAVYCTCRCDVPSMNTTDPANPIPVDKSLYNLCTCPSGFQCVPMCDRTHGNCATEAFGQWGSYCVKDAEVAYDNSDKVAPICSFESPGLPPPTN